MTPFETFGPDFASFLGRVRSAVDERLVSLWDARVAALGKHGPDVVAMASAARDLTLRGGKRFRAALLVAAYGGAAPFAMGPQAAPSPAPPSAAPRDALDPALQAGLALELLQTYLLIQDDWMDGDDTRRGGPAVHAALAAHHHSKHLGASSAMLASDLTWNLALELLATLDAAPARVVDTLRLFTRIHEDVVIGQQIDMLGHAEDVDAMHELKTGSYTVRGPLLLGATLAGAPEATLRALERYAAPLGVAFQLRDDLLGTYGAPEDTGKPVGNDIRAGKRTAILAEADARLSSEGRAVLDRAFGKADATEAEVLAATAALEACGARAAVTARLAKLCADARDLASALPLAAPAPALLAGAAAALAPNGALREGSHVARAEARP
jgi:geranylgeranyl diphosphate synthase type I